jgi:hypothetical protein
LNTDKEPHGPEVECHHCLQTQRAPFNDENQLIGIALTTIQPPSLDNLNAHMNEQSNVVPCFKCSAARPQRCMGAGKKKAQQHRPFP